MESPPLPPRPATGAGREASTATAPPPRSARNARGSVREQARGMSERM
ncbi:hypothetical protein B4589_003915 [Halolamina sp. CBA1230]|nr:hypothetical protein [Halolamina sp. CBA1230]QKY19564.1 hypothetical protein B4589_003915 [Halolamina sp. CBA1230]